MTIHLKIPNFGGPQINVNLSIKNRHEGLGVEQ